MTNPPKFPDTPMLDRYFDKRKKVDQAKKLFSWLTEQGYTLMDNHDRVVFMETGLACESQGIDLTRLEAEREAVVAWGVEADQDDTFRATMPQWQMVYRARRMSE